MGDKVIAVADIELENGLKRNSYNRGNHAKIIKMIEKEGSTNESKD